MPRLTVAFVLLLAAPAQAATVKVDESCYKDECTYTAVFVAAPGERNDVTATHDGADAVVVRDAGAPVAPGFDCVALDAQSARCAAPDQLLLHMWLGDGDDRATIDEGTVHGGAGADRLTAEVGELFGGPGADDLRSTGAVDFVDADGAHPVRDRYTGGPGRDDVSYQGRRRGVVVDLATGRAAEDEISGIEGAIGTVHDDVLIGTGGPNDLTGDRGHDRLVGRGGADQLEAQYGTIDAGPGNDAIELGGRRVAVRCGAGRDSVSALGRGAFLERCETLAFTSLWEDHARLYEQPRSALLTHLGCLCIRARYEARAAGVLVAQALGRPHALRLNARGRELLARRGRLAIAVRIREQTETGVDVAGFRTVLRRPDASTPLPGLRRRRP